MELNNEWIIIISLIKIKKINFKSNNINSN